MKHLAVFDKSDGQDILNGKKSVEIRFSRTKKLPFGVISAGDLVYIKERRGEVIGQFRVKKVFFFDNPDLSDLSSLSGLSDLKGVTRYATIIFIGESNRFITSPIKVSKHRSSWEVLS